MVLLFEVVFVVSGSDDEPWPFAGDGGEVSEVSAEVFILAPVIFDLGFVVFGVALPKRDFFGDAVVVGKPEGFAGGEHDGEGWDSECSGECSDGFGPREGCNGFGGEDAELVAAQLATAALGDFALAAAFGVGLDQLL